MTREFNGVKFFGISDLSCGYYLEKAEVVLQSFSPKKTYSNINHVIELHNIKKFFDNDLRLKKWTDTVFNHYKCITDNFERIIAIFFSNINDDNFLKVLEEVDYNYIDDFWSIFSKFKTYKHISIESFQAALEYSNVHLNALLKNKNIVNYYGQKIKDCLLKDPESAELLITQYLEKKVYSDYTLWFPKELSGELKESIILNYIRSDKANPNYLELIAESQSTPELPLNNKTKLEARKKYDAYIETMFSDNSGLRLGVEIIFAKTQDDIVVYTNSDSIHSISYSSNWIEENLDYPTLLNNFIYLFEYVDRFYRSQFVSLPAKLSVFERLIGVKGRTNYETGIDFVIRHKTFDLQMIAYRRELYKHNIKLENIFKWFFEVYLKDEFEAEGFSFSAPSDGTTDLEKV